jgi:NHL repeat
MVIYPSCKEKFQGSQFWSVAPTETRYYYKLIYFMALLLLVGCAVDSHEQVTQREILQPWTEITGTQVGSLQQGLPAQVNPPSGLDYITLQRPVSISARGNDIFLLDAGLRRIFRFDNFQQTLTPFATNLQIKAGMNIYVAPDMSVYVTDPAHEQVLHSNWDGTSLPPLVSRGNIARPVSVVVDLRNGLALVADGLFDQIIVFDNLGTTLSVIKPRRILSIGAMTSGPDGVYVVDRLSKRAAVIGWDGTFRYAFGLDALTAPGAIAVSRDNIVFISDNFDNTIKIYRRITTKSNNFVLADNVGGSQIAMDSFNGIGGLAVVGNQLYVADSSNSRVQIMLIDPRASDTRKIE